MKMITTMQQIDAYLVAESKRIEMLTIRALSFLGEKCIREARNRSGKESWFDQTGNLRSSVGYVVVSNGRVVQSSSFETIKQGAEGAKEGKNLASDLALHFNKGFVLIVVAGMHYAEYVEAMDNKAVLTSAELLAMRELPIIMNKLSKQVLR